MTDFGISVALLTPFGSDFRIDTARLASHAGNMIALGANKVTLFGTTGEGASVGFQERMTGLEALIEAAMPAEQIILGVSASSVDDAAAQVRQGLDVGVREFLLPPPFFFSSVGDDGLFDWHASVFHHCPAMARFILYSIPQVTGVAISTALAARLNSAFPGRVQAIKDSSGSWASARDFLERGTLPVLIGDERLLHRALPMGCAGSISGVANLFPERMCRIFASGQEDSALSKTVERIVAGPVIPGLKALLARAMSDDGWEQVRPPLSLLGADARSALLNFDDRARA